MSREQRPRTESRIAESFGQNQRSSGFILDRSVSCTLESVYVRPRAPRSHRTNRQSGILQASIPAVPMKEMVQCRSSGLVDSLSSAAPSRLCREACHKGNGRDIHG